MVARDLFTAAAMIGIFMNNKEEPDFSKEWHFEYCLEVAERMMKARHQAQLWRDREQILRPLQPTPDVRL